MQDRIFVLPSKQTIESGQSSVSNLPASLTSLIGREQEVRAVCALMWRPEMRLLTLAGPGGIGKTRLGIQVATELLDVFTDGVYFVSLALINDPNLVMATIAQVLGLQETREQSLFEGLKASLWDKHLLLLLDNLEQVLAAAPLLVELLQACPKLKLLVTSCAVLRVYGEHVFPVLPLALPNLKQLPDIETLMQCAAVTLFLERARTSQPNLQVTVTNVRAIAEICTRLDGLPLAIELAAARIKLLPPQALLARLEQRFHVLTSSARDVPARQQTLRNAITWSYNLLDEEEQRLFRRLCVFVGGCTLEAAEAVCTALGDRVEQVLDGIAALIDKSLLYQPEQGGEEAEEPRLQMLETIREYGLECLAASGETAEVKCAHAQYFLALVQELESKLAGEERFKWLDRLEHEHDNLRAARRWSIEQAGVGKTGCDIGEEGAMALWEGALKPLWLVQNHQDAFAVGQLATQEPVIIAKQPVGTFPASAQRTTTTARMLPPYPTGLTPREAEILRLVAQGLTDVQVAEQLVISPRTVNWHLSSIYSKLQISSRSAATRYAIEHKLV